MLIKTETKSPRVRRKRQERVQRILRAAMQLMAQEGLGGVTVQRLAEELDYTVGALYRYVPSKQALLAEMQLHAVAELAAHFRAVRERWQHRDDPLLTLMAIGDAYVGLLDELPHHIRLINFMLADPRNLIADGDVARTAPAFAALLGDVGQQFERAAAAGALSPGSAGKRTVMMWTALQGAVQLDKMTRFDRGAFDPHRVGTDLIYSLLIAWGADRTALDAARRELSEVPDDDSDRMSH